MKTILPEKITTIPEAQAFLSALVKNGESYHPEDNAHDIIVGHDINTHLFKKHEADHLNRLMEDIYYLEGNNGNHRNPIFDPCEFLNNIEE